MKKNKISKEPGDVQAAHDKGVNSTGLLCKNEPENIKDDLIVGFYTKHKGLKYESYVRLKKKDRNWIKIFELIGTDSFMSCVIRETLKQQKIIPGDWFDYR